MSERFYTNLPLVPGPFEITGPEARHLATVCRLRAGAEIRLFNGDGREYPARVVATSKNLVTLDVLRITEPRRELSFHLEIAAAVPKGDRAQFLVEKLTELGVATFVPLLCRYSVVQPGEGKIDKLARHVIEASKQCGRNVLMKIEEPVDWATYCGQSRGAEMRILAQPTPEEGGQGGQVKNLSYGGADVKKLRCAVGPEGGFTDEEIDLAKRHDWTLMDLGPRILRVETAALVLAARAAFFSIET